MGLGCWIEERQEGEIAHPSFSATTPLLREGIICLCSNPFEYLKEKIEACSHGSVMKCSFWSSLRSGLYHF